MSQSAAIRIVDENLNRVAEGLRVLEDISRMALDDSSLTQDLKTLRHNLIRTDLDFNLELLSSRDADGDIGAALEVTGEPAEKDLCLIAIANSRRVQEALRVLEEFAKLPGLTSKLNSNRFRDARFKIYVLEQNLISRLRKHYHDETD